MPKIKEEYQQARPNAVQVEMCEGCNLRCSFCGLNGIRGKANDYKFASREVLEATARGILEAGWNPRIEFAMHGEPTWHPDLLEVVAIFRMYLPKAHLMMTSNGGGLLKNPTEMIDGLLQHLNVLALDDYENVNIVPRILGKYQGNYEPLFYPKEKENNPHKRRKRNEHLLIIVQDIETATKGTHSTLNNHAGSGAPPNDHGWGKRCAKPFRELSIRWDGNVAICCNDWRGEYKCGNVLETPIDVIWNSPPFQAARKALYHGLRDFGPCAGCDAISYRPGLLPDHMGADSLPKPSEEDRKVIAKALEGQSYTAPVLRQWELQSIG